VSRTLLGGLALLALVATPAPAQQPPSPSEASGTISVIGRARSETPPDFASVEIGVEARGRTPGAALDATSEAARKIIALAGGFGVGEGDVGTTSVNLQPVTRSVRRPDGTVDEAPDGYRATNQVRLRLADMGRLGDLMRRTLELGANRIDGVSFGLKDPDAVQAGLRAAAMRDAAAQAAGLAEAAGVKLGRVVSIESPPREERGAMAYAAPAPMRARKAAVPLAAGTIEASAEVAARFAVAP